MPLYCHDAFRAQEGEAVEGPTRNTPAHWTYELEYSSTSMSLFYKTKGGQIVLGDSLEYMTSLKDESADLIVTSPPFGLVRKKDCGNVESDEYVEWFKPFGRAFRRVLKPSGSLVIDIGGAWIPVRRTRCAARLQRQANWGVLTNAM